MPKDGRSTRRAALGLIAILLIAFAARFAGAARLFRGQFPGNGTEGDLVNQVIDMYLRLPDLDPGMFLWPPFFKYCVLLAFKLYGLAWVGLLRMGSPRDFIVLNQCDKTWLYFIARSLSVGFGTATVAAAYSIARRLYDPAVALFAALFVALTPLHVEFSQYAQIDACMVFLTTAALASCLSIYQRGRRRDYILAGVLIGLGTAAKYLPALIFVSVFFAHRLAGRKTWRPLVESVAAAGLAFAAASPYSFLRLKSLLDVQSQFATEHDFDFSDKPAVILSFVGSGLGPALTALGAAGAALAWKKKRAELIVLGAFPACVIVFTLCWHPNAYYLLPVAPILGVFSCEALARARGRRLAAAALCAALLWPAWQVVSYDRKVFRRTTLEEAKDWIDANVPADARIVSFINSSDLLLSEFIRERAGGPTFVYSRYKHKFLRNDAEYSVDDLRKHGEKYLTVSDEDTTPAAARLIREAEARAKLVNKVDAAPRRLGPTVRVYAL